MLRKNISVGQLAGYAVANFVGLAIAVCALQFWRNLDAASAGSGGRDMFAASGYMSLSKPPSAMGALLGGSSGFTQKDIEALRRQPWVKRVAEFTPSRFDVTASVNFGGRGFTTALFFESVPDEFFDTLPSGWNFSPEKPMVPIIMPRDYLTLYNFGFAPSRGLPQLTEGLLTQIPLRISVSGNGRQQVMAARVAGFSSRVNTIAVPEQFMTYANEMFGEPATEREEAQRLMVEVADAGSPDIGPYLRSHGMEAGGSDGVGGKMASTLRWLTAIVLGVGVVIAALALFVLLLSIGLIIQKNRQKIADLHLLGYTYGDVARGYAALVGGVNIVVLGLVIGAVAVAQSALGRQLASLGYSSASLWPTLLAAIGVMALITLLNYAVLRKYAKAATK